MEVREASANYSGLSELPGEAVPLGYRQTEVGVIPKDWNLAKLGDFATFRTGPFGSALHKADYVEDGVPVINPMQIDNGRIFPTASMAVTEAAARKLADFRLTAGEVIIGRRGEMGRCAVVPTEQAGWLCGTGSMIVRAKPSLDAGFIQRVLSSPPIISAIENASVGSTMINLNQGTLANLRVALPPVKEEQEAIAEALSEADALIESLEQLIAKKRLIKQSTMQALLTPREGWSETSLLELAGGKKELFDDGDWIESEHITDAGIRLIQTGNIGVGEFVEKDLKKYIFETSFISLRCKEIVEGDLLICRLADPAGRACVLPDIGETKVVTSVDVTIFRPPADVANREFLAYLFSTDDWFRDVSDRSGGTTHKRISRGALGRIKITIPRVEEQSAIATILTDMDTELADLETRLAKTRQLKQGMMQELLTGRIRLVPRTIPGAKSC